MIWFGGIEFDISTKVLYVQLSLDFAEETGDESSSFDIKSGRLSI